MACAYFSAFIFSPFLTLGCCLVLTLDSRRISRYPLWMSFSLTLFPITRATNFLLLFVLLLNQSPECYETTSFCSFSAQTFFLQSTSCISCVFVLLWDFPLSKWPTHYKENGENSLLWQSGHDLMTFCCLWSERWHSPSFTYMRYLVV